MQPRGHVRAAGRRDQSIHVKEEILTRARISGRANFREVDAAQRVAQPPSVLPRHDAALREHHEMPLVQRHHRLEEQRLGVFEVLVEDGADVIRRKGHVVQTRRALPAIAATLASASSIAE